MDVTRVIRCMYTQQVVSTIIQGGGRGAGHDSAECYYLKTICHVYLDESLDHSYRLKYQCRVPTH
jgi:hypothetical protein